MLRRRTVSSTPDKTLFGTLGARLRNVWLLRNPWHLSNRLALRGGVRGWSDEVKPVEPATDPEPPELSIAA